jgi:multidrug resistance efflux pump
VTGPEELVSSIERKKLQLDLESAKIALDQVKTKAARQKRTDDQDLNGLVETRDSAKGEAKRIASQLPMMQVKAPRAGTVVYMTRGDEKFKVGDQTWKLGPVMQIVGLSKMRGAGRIDEVDLAKVAVGQAVTVHLDALPDVEVRGKILEIAKALQPKSPTDPSKTIGVKIALDPTTAPLRPGMRFRGQVETDRRVNIVQVPLDAVFATPEGPVAYKESGGGGALAQVKLVVGRRSTSMVEVTSGLAAGDRVSRIDPSAGKK